ncbi:MAG: hypothetical protein ACI91O_001066 [Candidatus Poriferisodalaceae bacterium]|jgi:hypothetical protein
MRVGIDLRGLSPDDRLIAAVEADRLGLWAVLIDGGDGHESVAAGELAVATSDIHIAACFADDHPLTIAEDAAILDHLSARRMLAVVANGTDVVRALLAGHIVDGVALAPPPAQTTVTVWHPDDVEAIQLSGDLSTDRHIIDQRRDAGTTHLFVSWPGDLATLARHLVTRAATPDFPQLVADLADRLPD